MASIGEVEDSETVSQLTARLRSDLTHRFAAVRVRGEIGEWTRAASGHIYFSLKDATARLSAVLWRSTAMRVAPRDLQPGTEVVAGGRIDVYAPRGTYALQVDRLVAAGRGDLHLRFEKLKELLRTRGWFDSDRKRALPFFPRVIGVVTSPGGAALHDFLDTLFQRFPCVHVKIMPARVQGTGSAEEIAAAIRALDRLRDIDVIVVTRGGGSLEDLWSFNEEVVARAIFECRRPVISGVGHETDTTIADLVADQRAKTPTEAALLVAPRRGDLVAELDRSFVRAQRAMQRRLLDASRHVEMLGAGRALGRPELEVERWGRELNVLQARALASMQGTWKRAAARVLALQDRLHGLAPHRRLASDLLRMNEAGTRLERARGIMLQRAEQQLAERAALLEAHSPVKVLARGFSVANRAGDQQPLTSAAVLAVGDAIETTLLDGRVTSRIEHIEHLPPLQMDAAGPTSS